MGPSYEKLLAKAQMMRREYDELLHSVRYPEVPEVRRQKLSVSLLPGLETDLYLYRPVGLEGKTLPAYISLHSGAWVRGNATQDDYRSRMTAFRASCVVICPEFCLAPEYQYPTQLEEVAAVTKHVRAHAMDWNIDSERIAIGGHNTGGNLAAAAALLLQARSELYLKCMVLCCPTICLVEEDNYLPDFDLDDPLRGPIRGAFFNTCYLGDLSRASEPYASPSLAPADKLPPALIITAGKDPARAATEAYAAARQRAGCQTTYICYEGQPHGFHVQPGLASPEDADQVFYTIDNYLKSNL